MYRISAENLVLDVELGGDAPDEVETADAWVTLADGTRWTATFFTHAEVGRVMERWRASGECLGGRYFACRPDLVITREPGVREMLAVVRDLVATGQHESMLHRVG
jgi:hypothetical protein